MDIAVLLPCYNEGPAIYNVVRGFQAALPGATVYVYDNNSTDNTIAEATRAGAVVRKESLKGKGNVIRRMFADIDADIYIMADGDATYDPATAPLMIRKLVEDNLDMVAGKRIAAQGQATYRPGHVTGNRLLTSIVMLIFGEGLTDILSGYRAFSRRFVKSFPAVSQGFETETEISIHALSLNIPSGEVPTPYFERGEGSASKLKTYNDGIRILNFIILLFKEIKPFLFFSLVALGLAALSLALGLPVIATYFETGLVPRLPTALLSASIMLSAFISFICGIILDSVSRGRLELKRLAYLVLPPLPRKD